MAQGRFDRATAKSKTVLLFVHGYNVSFAYAALRTAPLAATALLRRRLAE